MSSTFVPNRASKLLIYPGAHPVALDLWVIRNLGKDSVLWEPETLWQEMGRATGFNPSEVVRNKIQAARLVHLQDSPFEAWETFEKVIQAFDGAVPRFDIMQPTSPPVLMAGVETMKTIRFRELGEEAKRYAASSFLNSGLVYAPPPLDGINPLIEERLPDKKIIALVKRALSTGAAPLREDDPVGIQVAKISTAKTYAEQMRNRMVAHTKLVQSEIADEQAERRRVDQEGWPMALVGGGPPA